MAPDGTGGLVYTKVVEGVPHVFASRFAGGLWSAPIRVDWDQPYDAAQPRVTAGGKGELLVVWVTEVATVGKKPRLGLFSARLAPGASGFGHSLLVDPNVGEGRGLDPSVAQSAPGNAIVAYRVITHEFQPGQASLNGEVQLRPGDVMADVRLARLSGGRWSRLGAINRNPAASMRPPTATNGPQVEVGATGNAVVVWQEPDSSGAARIWIRRVFGTTLGSPFQVSPSTWEGKPVVEDADSFALAVSALDRVEVAVHVAGGAESALGGPRVFLSSMGSSSTSGSGQPGPLQLVGGSAFAPGLLGSGSVSLVDGGGGQGRMSLAWLEGSGVRVFRAGESGGLAGVPLASAPPAQTGAVATTTAAPEGGGIVAYPALDTQGGQMVAVLQQAPDGTVQASSLTGTETGTVAELGIAPSGTGDGLIGFRQGEPGDFEIVGARITAPPSQFKLQATSSWQLPSKVRLHWGATASSVGGVTYAVLVDGLPVREGLRALSFHPSPADLGNGIVQARVMATDAIGEQTLTSPVKLRVDGQPPIAHVALNQGKRRLTVRIKDLDSGLRGGATDVVFGDGSHHRGGSHVTHVYARPGHYTLTIHARDQVGNSLVQRLPVTVR